jgi:hypothetical protein
VEDALEEKLGAVECENGHVEAQWGNAKKCVLDMVSDLVGKFKTRARTLYFAQ